MNRTFPSLAKDQLFPPPRVGTHKLGSQPEPGSQVGPAGGKRSRAGSGKVLHWVPSPGVGRARGCPEERPGAQGCGSPGGSPRTSSPPPAIRAAPPGVKRGSCGAVADPLALPGSGGMRKHGGAGRAGARSARGGGGAPSGPSAGERDAAGGGASRYGPCLPLPCSPVFWRGRVQPRAVPKFADAARELRSGRRRVSQRRAAGAPRPDPNPSPSPARSPAPCRAPRPVPLPVSVPLLVLLAPRPSSLLSRLVPERARGARQRRGRARRDRCGAQPQSLRSAGNGRALGPGRSEQAAAGD